MPGPFTSGAIAFFDSSNPSILVRATTASAMLMPKLIDSYSSAGDKLMAAMRNIRSRNSPNVVRAAGTRKILRATEVPAAKAATTGSMLSARGGNSGTLPRFLNNVSSLGADARNIAYATFAYKRLALVGATRSRETRTVNSVRNSATKPLGAATLAFGCVAAFAVCPTTIGESNVKTRVSFFSMSVRLLSHRARLSYTQGPVQMRGRSTHL